MEPEALLFTDLDGNQAQLQEVIYDGLDRGYAARYPALTRLLRAGRPEHRLYACAMLASWGVAEGLRTLIQWARDPDAAPWAAEPVTFDRFSGADSAFEMLAEAVRVAGEIERGDELDALRAEAARALLGIYHRVFFGRSLMVVFDLDRPLAATVRADLGAAVERAVAAARAWEGPFDLATQAAFLLGPLAFLDDARAARAAEALLAAHAGQVRTAREVAYALGWGAGPATRAILGRLVESPVESVRRDAREALARREAGG